MTTLLQSGHLRKIFLETLALKGTVTAASEAARISRMTAYDWKRDDPTFAAEWADAELQYVENLENEARRRAVDGDDIPVFQRGQHVGNIRKRSDVLLMFLLNGAAPEKYRPREKSDVNILANGGTVQIQVNYDYNDPRLEKTITPQREITLPLESPPSEVTIEGTYHVAAYPSEREETPEETDPVPSDHRDA